MTILPQTNGSKKSNSMKFEAGFITILLFGGIIFFIDIIDKWDGYLYYIFIELTILNVIVLFYQWVNLYISSVTREKRALFDEENILETYQPRAYTQGHLFVPEPPTPAEVDVDGNNMKIKRSENEKNEFNRLRDSHYENMYQKALELSNAVEAENKGAEFAESNKINQDKSNENKKSDQPNNDKNHPNKNINEDDIIQV